MYTSVNAYYQKKFGCKVYKLSIHGGFTCPNRDGTLGTGGCIFCSAAGGGEFAAPVCTSVTEQLQSAKQKVQAKNKNGKYIAYFQSFTNTYAPVKVLRQKFYQAIALPDVVGLSIGTRPDCLPEDVIALLAEINKIKPVSVELGLQTVHDSTAEYIRRGYKTPVYFDAVKRLKNCGIEVVTHIILGLPGETEAMMLETTRQVIQAGTNGVKFHLLHVLRGTDLEKEYLSGAFSCLTLENYAAILKKCLVLLPPEVVVHRITGDGAKRDLVAPLWSADKKKVINYLNQYLQK